MVEMNSISLPYKRHPNLKPGEPFEKKDERASGFLRKIPKFFGRSKESGAEMDSLKNCLGPAELHRKDTWAEVSTVDPEQKFREMSKIAPSPPRPRTEKPTPTRPGPTKVPKALPNAQPAQVAEYNMEHICQFAHTIPRSGLASANDIRVQMNSS